MTTTLINLNTPKPLATIPNQFKIYDTSTITASKQLKPSVKYMPLDANAFNTISTKKKVKKAESICAIMYGSVSKDSENTKSNRMNTA